MKKTWIVFYIFLASFTISLADADNATSEHLTTCHVELLKRAALVGQEALVPELDTSPAMPMYKELFDALGNLAPFFVDSDLAVDGSFNTYFEHHEGGFPKLSKDRLIQMFPESGLSEPMGPPSASSGGLPADYNACLKGSESSPPPYPPPPDTDDTGVGSWQTKIFFNSSTTITDEPEYNTGESGDPLKALNSLLPMIKNLNGWKWV